jgi:hypothetical protein
MVLYEHTDNFFSTHCELASAQMFASEAPGGRILRCCSGFTDANHGELQVWSECRPTVRHAHSGSREQGQLATVACETA